MFIFFLRHSLVVHHLLRKILDLPLLRISFGSIFLPLPSYESSWAEIPGPNSLMTAPFYLVVEA